MDDDNGLIQCERCQKWICRKCADISHEEFVVISHNGRFHWFCDDCDLLAMAAVENSKKVDGKKVNISQCDMQRLVLSRVTKIMDKIETQNDLHLLQTEKIASSYADALRKENDVITNEVCSQVSSINKNLEKIAQAPVIAATELKDRESRKECVIISGVPESDSHEQETRVEHDLLEMKKICANGLNINVSIDKITRMKSKNGIGPRPIKVKFIDEKTKWLVVRNAKKLAQVDGMKTVFIKPDMTTAEREEDWKLRQELKEKRKESDEKQDGAKWIIRRNKVINIARTPLR